MDSASSTYAHVPFTIGSDNFFVLSLVSLLYSTTTIHHANEMKNKENNNNDG